jgi:hypothetical protein
LPLEPFVKPIFGRNCRFDNSVPIAALLVGGKCLVEPQYTALFTSSRLALEQNPEFCKRLIRKK